MIKKLAAFTIALSLFAGILPTATFAETVTSTTSVQMQTYLEQIKKLQDQLAELTKKRGETVTELRETMALAGELRQGMTSEEVKALQEILAADPDIYPEGLVTGFYGALTAKAVAKFQKKHGVEGEVAVGTMTRARLNALANDSDFKCKAWGKLIAPGLAKKRLGNASIDLSACGKVPAGIIKKIDTDWKHGTSTATSTDTRAPGISNIDTDDVTHESIVVSWETNERTKAVVWYGTDEDVDLDDAEKETSSTFALEHELTLEDLDEDTEYFFIVVATDKAGNTATSSVQDFETEND
ncbi:MAG: fibronectin type III domain-containing protein [Patescibacteria group bacterium]